MRRDWVIRGLILMRSSQTRQHCLLPWGSRSIPRVQGAPGLPVIGINGLFTLGFSSNGPQPRIDQTYGLTDNFTIVKGKHTLKFGIDDRRFHVSNPFFASNSGTYAFNGAGLFSTRVPGADFLLGSPDTYSQGSGSFIDASSQGYYTYAQDSWKATPNFTINYGLGWQINTPVTDHFNHDRSINCFRPGQQSAVYPTAPAGLVFPGDALNTASGYQTGFTHFGPRLGLAWAPHWGRFTGDQGKFSIRAGVGVYFNQIEEELTLQNLQAPPFLLWGAAARENQSGHPSFAAPFNSINPGVVTFTSYNGTNATKPVTTATVNPVTITNKFPFTPPPAGSNVDFTFFEPMSLNLLDPRFSVPYAINDNVTVQRELPGQMVLSVGYVGSFGRHLERAFDLNPGINPAACAADPVCVANRVVQGFVAPQNFKYDPLVFGGLGQQATDGVSHYHSLQVFLQKRISHGLTYAIAYTYSHAIDNGSSFENTSFGTRGTDTSPFLASTLVIRRSMRVTASWPTTRTKSPFLSSLRECRNKGLPAVPRLESGGNYYPSEGVPDQHLQLGFHVADVLCLLLLRLPRQCEPGCTVNPNHESQEFPRRTCGLRRRTLLSPAFGTFR